jgi:predicted Rossmann fold flavoprotein
VPRAVLRVEGTDLVQRGPLLVTHWGLSGPAVLKLSAWGAREFHARGYQARLRVNWSGEKSQEGLKAALQAVRAEHPRQTAPGDPRSGLPRRLWERLAAAAGLKGLRWSQVSNEKLAAFVRELQEGLYLVTGKSTFKDEFVTCGGVRLDEVDFRTLESKRRRGLYFAGEILDIDGVTGGFNFQRAWTTGGIAGRSAAGAGTRGKALPAS